MESELLINAEIEDIINENGVFTFKLLEDLFYKYIFAKQLKQGLVFVKESTENYATIDFNIFVKDADRNTVTKDAYTILELAKDVLPWGTYFNVNVHQIDWI